MENYFFLEKYVSSEGAVSLNVLCYHQLSIARYQVIFCANNYFEWLPIVSSAFKFRVHKPRGYQYLDLPFWSVNNFGLLSLLKAVDTIGNYSKHKTLLGDE